ncbi:Nucleolar MIF4G domain-containing protein 1 [Bienertia sinuspersici]
MRMSKRDMKKGNKKKTKFEEFLELETKTGPSMEEDLEMERRLAKKLKLKKGKLDDAGDGLDSLFKGIPSLIDSFEEEDGIVNNKTESLQRKKKGKKLKKSTEPEVVLGKDGDEGDEENANGETGTKTKMVGNGEKKKNKKRKRKRRKLEGKMDSDDDDDVDTSDMKHTKTMSVDSGETNDASPANGLQSVGKYVAPHLRSCSGGDSQEYLQIRRRVRGLLNRMSESNVESITGEIFSIFQSVSRAVASQIISEEVLASCAGGPRGNEHFALLLLLLFSQFAGVTVSFCTTACAISQGIETNNLNKTNEDPKYILISIRADTIRIAMQESIDHQPWVPIFYDGGAIDVRYAAVFAAFVAGMASMVGIDFGARLMESVAKSFEDEYSKEDNLSLRNLSLLLSYLCIFGVCSSDLIYDFLIRLSKRLTEIDVSTILTVLQCCGMKLRGDDPAAMKDFIVSVQSRVNELKATEGSAEAITYGRRMEFMLETICDIKNNKKRTKEDSLPHTRVKKWLQKLRVEDITIRGVKWSKLLDPKKKGQWWFSTDGSPTDEIHNVAGKMDKEVNEAQKMLKLAAKQRMNTDTRRAIFCVIMSGEDYIDTFEQLLSMNLQGKQDREIIRVLVECCLQEKMFNKYYTALASKLCSHDKNHKFTLQEREDRDAAVGGCDDREGCCRGSKVVVDRMRLCGGRRWLSLILAVVRWSYCLWDHWKDVESMPLMRSMHLAKFVAEMLASFSLPLAVLKVVDLIDASQLTTKRIMHFRMLFEAVFGYPDSVVWNVFTRAAITPELEELRNGMEFFIREYVISLNKGVAKKFKLAKKALNNAEGVLM